MYTYLMVISCKSQPPIQNTTQACGAHSFMQHTTLWQFSTQVIHVLHFHSHLSMVFLRLYHGLEGLGGC